MHVHGAARARAPAPAPRATFIANTDMPFRRPKKVTNTNQESWYLVRRASSTGEVTEGKVPPNEKGRGQRPKNPLKFDTVHRVQIFAGIFISKKDLIHN